MKYISMMVLMVIASAAFAVAQKGTFSFNATGGYTFKERVNFDLSYANVSDGFQYGGGFEYYTSNAQSVELSYQRIAVDFPLYGPAGAKLSDGSGSVNYILLGGNSYFGKSYDAKAQPFIGGGLGVGILSGGGESASKFAWNIKTGVKINTGKAVSFKLNAYLQSVISTFGYDYWSTWYGPVAVPDYATLLQFGLGGAVCFDFPKKR